MENSITANEIAEQLQEIRRQNKKFIWIVVGLVSILAVLIGYWFTQNQAFASFEQLGGNSANNVIQLSSKSGGSIDGIGGAGGSGGGGGCCGGSGSSGSSGGGCGSGTATQIASPELEQQALATYKAEFGDQEGIKAVVMDLGCHQEVNIIDKDSNLLKRYAYRGGQLSLL